MGPLVFLVLVVVVSAVGIFVLWARSRPTSSPEASIAEFNAKLKALGGDGEPDDARSRGRD